MIGVTSNLVERVLLVIILAAVDISVVICHNFSVNKRNIANLKQLSGIFKCICCHKIPTLHLKQSAWNEAPGILSRLPSRHLLHLLHFPSFLYEYQNRIFQRVNMTWWNNNLVVSLTNGFVVVVGVIFSINHLTTVMTLLLLSLEKFLQFQMLLLNLELTL